MYGQSLQKICMFLYREKYVYNVYVYTLYIIQCISNQLGVTDVQAISRLCGRLSPIGVKQGSAC